MSKVILLVILGCLILVFGVVLIVLRHLVPIWYARIQLLIFGQRIQSLRGNRAATYATLGVAVVLFGVLFLVVAVITAMKGGG